MMQVVLLVRAISNILFITIYILVCCAAHEVGQIVGDTTLLVEDNCDPPRVDTTTGDP